MPRKVLAMLDVRSREAWRDWLKEHHDSAAEIWLVFWKRHTAVTTLTYEEAIEEAICFGWVDSLVRRIDEERYARKFTPRKPEGAWSTLNRTRYAGLLARGLIAAPGLRVGPSAASRSGDAPRPSATALPAYIERGLRTHAKAWTAFERMAPSHRRAYIGWIDSAKREETRQKRLREAIEMLSAGTVGLK